ncbi:MAG TPA: glycosyltransferase family 4 protein [Solirubrobacteraceae bacterium]
MIVHQVLSGAGPVDAVTSQALAWRERFSAWGWGGSDVAVHIDPRMNGAVRPLGSLSPGRSDVLLIHYSAYAPRLRGLLDLPNRKALLSHNVTPARWLWDHEPQVAVQCALGRRQLPEFAARVDVAAGVSAFNAAEVGSDVVVPVLFDAAAWPAAGASRAAPADRPPTILFVGRLAPHKRQDELVRLVAALRGHRLPDARLVLVGEPLNEKYLAALQGLAESLAPGAVAFERGLSRAELAARYRAADVFVSLSEHEGFCVPLLEAFHFGVPVVARPSGGVPEVAGDAALLPADRDLAVLAELVALAIEDVPLADALRTRGRARLAAFAPERAEEAMRRLLEELAA